MSAGASATVAVIGPLFDPPEAAADRARLEQSGATVRLGRPMTEGELIRDCGGAEIIMSLAHPPFTDKVFAALPQLVFLQQCSVGFDKVDVPAATRHGVSVANSPTFCIEEVAETASMLLLACARRLARQIHAGRAQGWTRPAAVEAMGRTGRLKGQTLGFVAFGKIARLTAERMRGFGLRYLAYDPYLKPADVAAWGVELVSLEELCRQSDLVSMHALLNDATRGFFGEAQFRAMKPTACFVNTSRGATVDEAALIRALEEGWIAGAGLDVLQQEPPRPDNPLLRHPGVIWTPHTAGHSDRSVAENRRDSVDEVLRVLGGEWPRALINPAVRANARFRAHA
jgi:D-3-phosphoglycerate dehydrogenase